MASVFHGPERGQGTDPPADRHPPAYPPIAAILAQRRLITDSLTACGIPDRDLPDMAQVVTVAAWTAIREGRYRPDPAYPPSAVLRAWLRGIAWRQASHYRENAYHLHELPFADPSALVDRASRDPHDQLAARDALRAVALLPERYIGVLSAVACGEKVRAYARANGIPEASVWSRLRLARAELGECLAGRGWRRP